MKLRFLLVVVLSFGFVSGMDAAHLRPGNVLKDLGTMKGVLDQLKEQSVAGGRAGNDLGGSGVGSREEIAEGFNNRCGELDGRCGKLDSEVEKLNGRVQKLEDLPQIVQTLTEQVTAFISPKNVGVTVQGDYFAAGTTVDGKNLARESLEVFLVEIDKRIKAVPDIIASAVEGHRQESILLIEKLLPVCWRSLVDVQNTFKSEVQLEQIRMAGDLLKVLEAEKATFEEVERLSNDLSSKHGSLVDAKKQAVQQQEQFTQQFA